MVCASCQTLGRRNAWQTSRRRTSTPSKVLSACESLTFHGILSLPVCFPATGTPFWMAPEVIRQTGHGFPADVWSVGCTVVEMATGSPPWSHFESAIAAMYHIAVSKESPPVPDFLPPEAKCVLRLACCGPPVPSVLVGPVCRDFLALCFERDPAKRADVKTLLKHPFVTAPASMQPRFESQSSRGSLHSLHRPSAPVVTPITLTVTDRTCRPAPADSPVSGVAVCSSDSCVACRSDASPCMLAGFTSSTAMSPQMPSSCSTLPFHRSASEGRNPFARPRAMSSGTESQPLTDRSVVSQMRTSRLPPAIQPDEPCYSDVLTTPIVLAMRTEPTYTEGGSPRQHFHHRGRTGSSVSDMRLSPACEVAGAVFRGDSRVDEGDEGMEEEEDSEDDVDMLEDSTAESGMKPSAPHPKVGRLPIPSHPFGSPVRALFNSRGELITSSVPSSQRTRSDSTLSHATSVQPWHRNSCSSTSLDTSPVLGALSVSSPKLPNLAAIDIGYPVLAGAEQTPSRSAVSSQNSHKPALLLQGTPAVRRRVFLSPPVSSPAVVASILDQDHPHAIQPTLLSRMPPTFVSSPSPSEALSVGTPTPFSPKATLFPAELLPQQASPLPGTPLTSETEASASDVTFMRTIQQQQLQQHTPSMVVVRASSQSLLNKRSSSDSLTPGAKVRMVLETEGAAAGMGVAGGDVHPAVSAAQFEQLISPVVPTLRQLGTVRTGASRGHLFGPLPVPAEPSNAVHSSCNDIQSPAATKPRNIRTPTARPCVFVETERPLPAHGLAATPVESKFTLFAT